MSLTRILFSWLYPIGLSLAFMSYVLPLVPAMAPWYFSFPVAGFITWLFREDLIDTFGVHTIFSYTMVKKSYEELTPEQKEKFDGAVKDQESSQDSDTTNGGSNEDLH
jgi:hypothetical protein